MDKHLQFPIELSTMNYMIQNNLLKMYFTKHPDYYIVIQDKMRSKYNDA